MMIDGSEDVGLDFNSFYDLMLTLCRVKEFGKTQYGSVNFDVIILNSGILIIIGC